MQSKLEKYAQLLVKYSLDIKKGDRVFIQTTTEAIPLLKEVYKECLKAGGIPEIDLSFEDKDQLFYTYASDYALQTPSLGYKTGMEAFDAYLVIRAPINATSLNNIDPQRLTQRQEALGKWKALYTTRTASGELKRTLCQYPTESMAKLAEMSIEDYTDFILTACKVNDKNPINAWLEVRKNQQKIVSFLNQRDRIRYVSPNMDISFSTKGRIWINSDGRTNMPSGEVFTAPVENSVNGLIHFSYPSLYRGRDVKDVKLWVKDGYIEKWEASSGLEVLDEIFKIPGARRFGEAAIGTNYDIQRTTRNILFDEKIGGSIHMAVGQSYYHCGGKNDSSVHWDMISDMVNGGEIWADDEMIYQNGKFLFL